jgi:hypothetical protein
MANESVVTMSSDVLDVDLKASPAPQSTEPEATAEPETEKPEGDVETEAKEEETEVKETARERHNRRQWERLTKERAEYKAKAEFYESQKTQQAQPKTDRPARENFTSDEDYVEALTDYKVKQHMEPLQRNLQAQTKAQQVEAEWSNKIAVAEKTYSDYKEVMEEANDIPITPEMAEAIKTSDLGADIAYHLAKNPEDAMRISQMPPMAAARELGRIESYLEYEKNQAKTTKVSKAPPPARVPTGGSTVRSGTKNLSEMSYSDYVKARMESRKSR